MDSLTVVNFMVVYVGLLSYLILYIVVLVYPLHVFFM